MRAVGIDYGKVRVGIAISDPGQTIAHPHSIINITSPKNAARQIVELIKTLEIDIIIIGLPLLLSGKEGEAAESARLLGKEIGKRTKIKIEYIDERFSSSSAEKTMHDNGVSEKKMRGKVDKIAAALILQTYLDKKRP